jgi:hypothetical protein
VLRIKKEKDNGIEQIDLLAFRRLVLQNLVRGLYKLTVVDGKIDDRTKIPATNQIRKTKFINHLLTRQKKKKSILEKKFKNFLKEP